MHPNSWIHKKCGIIQERGAFSMPRINKKYTPEFKIEVMETKIKEKLSSYEAARNFKMTIHINCY